MTSCSTSSSPPTIRPSSTARATTSAPSIARPSSRSTPEQEEAARRGIERAQADWPAPIVTTIEPACDWYPAEDYHQDYWAGEGQRNPYCLADHPAQAEEAAQELRPPGEERGGERLTLLLASLLLAAAAPAAQCPIAVTAAADHSFAEAGWDGSPERLAPLAAATRQRFEAAARRLCAQGAAEPADLARFRTPGRPERRGGDRAAPLPDRGDGARRLGLPIRLPGRRPAEPAAFEQALRCWKRPKRATSGIERAGYIGKRSGSLTAPMSRPLNIDFFRSSCFLPLNNGGCPSIWMAIAPISAPAWRPPRAKPTSRGCQTCSSPRHGAR